MAITFLEKRKEQRYLIIVFAIVIVAILLVVWRGFLINKELTPPPVEKIVVPPKPEIKINWDILTNPRLGELQPFEEIPIFSGQMGRENPFTPYPTSTTPYPTSTTPYPTSTMSYPTSTSNP